MSKKSNVHPDYYKTDGRDRPDDAARARLARAVAAKAASQERPDRMTKGFYFERPEPPGPAPAGAAAGASRGGAKKAADSGPSRPKKAAARKASARRRAATGRKAGGAGRRRKTGPRPAPPAKKR